MKINNDSKPEVQSGSAGALGRAAESSSSAAAKGALVPVGTDQVTLSPESRLLQAAAANSSTPEIRQDIVERMRALMNDCALGVEAERLADSIIDDLLSRS